MEYEFNEWLKDRPEVIKKMAEKLKPWLKYKLKTTGQHCTIYSFSEDGTVTIYIDGHDDEVLNKINQLIAIKVFGIDPDDLEVIELAPIREN